MKLNILLTGIVLILTACNHKLTDSNNTIDSTMSQSVSKMKIDRHDKNSRSTFIYQDDTLLQQIVLLSRNDSVVYFIFSSTNKRDNSTCEIKGIAKGQPNQDPEIDEDEETGAYPAIEYIYHDTCTLSIRIDMDSNTKITTIDHDCKMRAKCHCTLTSPGILHKVK